MFVEFIELIGTIVAGRPGSLEAGKDFKLAKLI